MSIAFLLSLKIDQLGKREDARFLIYFLVLSRKDFICDKIEFCIFYII